MRAISRPLRSASALACLVLAALLLVGCAPSDPPPTSPLDEDSGTPRVTSTPSPSTPTPDAPVTVTDTPFVTPTSDASADAERITGEAITRIAEWTGAPETEFRLTSIEAVDWPDACLGVRNPAIACAEVITPGYEVTLHHVSEPNVPYLVHASEAGRYVWAPTHGPESRTIVSVDPDTGTLTLEPDAASEEPIGTELRTVPGSDLDVPLQDLAPGQRVRLGAAAPIEGGTAALVVFLTPIDE